MPRVVVGNEFIVPVRRRHVAAAVPIIIAPVPRQELIASEPVLHDIEIGFEKVSRAQWLLDFLHRHSVIVFALLFLVVGSSAIQVGSAYVSARYAVAAPTPNSITLPAKPMQGPNTVVETSKLSETLASITSQPLSLTFGDKSASINSEQIRSWLEIVKHKDVSYIHVKQGAITPTLNEAAKPFVKEPLNQVTIPAADGSSRVIAAGRNGTKLGDITPFTQQISRDLLSSKGMQLAMPIETLPFASVTPSAFDKMIEINVTSKQMYLWQNGQIYKSYPISAGAPETPTPLGQYKIFSKLAVQDMRGYNADGTKYFQPKVKWVSYFLSGGYAIHGNYWRPASWFGNINSSHGCASLPDAQAKEVYDWGPIGTTVITHN